MIDVVGNNTAAVQGPMLNGLSFCPTVHEPALTKRGQTQPIRADYTWVQVATVTFEKMVQPRGFRYRHQKDHRAYTAKLEDENAVIYIFYIIISNI